jgi:threonine synthase
VFAWLQIHKDTQNTGVDFSVPTGNFGDIFAGYIAKQLLPEGAIRKLILATNENNLLTRFINHGDYSVAKVVPTSSPSMDIQVASNFERYLYYLYDKNPAMVARDLELFSKNGNLQFSQELQHRICQDFVSKSVNEQETIATIKEFFVTNGYLLDPHTAVGVNAAKACRVPEVPVVCLATAHPAKFGDAVSRATGQEPDLPEPLRDLTQKESKCEVIDAEPKDIQQYIIDHALL